MKVKKRVFEKELIKTKLFLAKNKLPEINPINKEIFIKKILNNTVNIINKKEYNCSICLDKMEDEIYSGDCGHCFHKKCVFSLPEEKCPLCRKYTKFSNYF